MRDPHRMRDTIELQLNNRQIVSFVIGSLVVLGLVFALGVMVGKQLAGGGGPVGPQPPKDPLAAIDAKEKLRTAEPPAPDASLTFADELTKPKAVDPAIEPTKPPKAEKDKKADKKEKAKADKEKRAAAAADPTSEGADAVAASGDLEPAAAEPRPEARPEPKPHAKEKSKDEAKRKGDLAAAFSSATKSGAFCLQVSSMPSQADADKVVAKLANKGFPGAVVAEAEVPGKGRMFRVRLGSYESRAEAEAALKDFKKKSGMDALVASAR